MKISWSNIALGLCSGLIYGAVFPFEWKPALAMASIALLSWVAGALTAIGLSE
jgi:hypothetical protein